MARLMLSLPTVMCCYVTQAGKALLCSHAWLHDTRREVSERGEGRRKEEDERIEYRSRKRWRAQLRRGFRRRNGWTGDERRGRGLIGVEEKQNIRKKLKQNRWQVREVNKNWMRHQINPIVGTNTIPPGTDEVNSWRQKVRRKTNDSQVAKQALPTWVSHIVTH